MGDTILLTPALRMLHEWRPDLGVTVLLDPPWAELLEGNEAVKSTLVTRGKLETLRRIRERKFDAVINLHGGPTSALLTRFSAARLRIGLAQYRSPASYNVIVPRSQHILENPAHSERLHTAEHLALVLYWLGVPITAIPPAQLFLSSHAKSAAAERLRSMGIDPAERYAVIHPGALYQTKQWPAERFAQLAAHLKSRHGLKTVLLGGTQDEHAIEQIRQQMERVSSAPVIRALGLPLGEMAGVISNARLFIGNDSGPAHAATALGVPVAVIFGSSSSTLWGPWRAKAAAVIQNHYECNPCPGDRCYSYSEPQCILSIEAAQVCAAIDNLMKSS